jgi:large subunit ribosomal protein L25
VADNVDLQAREREGRGKNAARRLRGSGMIPAVLYGDGSSTALAVPDKVVDYTLHHLGDNALYDIDLGTGAATARIVDVQRDPVSGRLIRAHRGHGAATRGRRIAGR